MLCVALLRGINVGGKGIMKMEALRACFERAGFSDVVTYIQSGNIIFETGERSVSAVLGKVENALAKAFGYKAAVVVQSQAQFRNVIADAPADWPRGSHLRRYVVFLRAPVTAKEALKHVEVREGIDKVSPGKGVLYTSTVLSGLSKSRLTKLVSRPVYQDMTIRNYSTCLKILDLMNVALRVCKPAT